LQDFMNRLEEARRCWLKHKMRGPEGCQSVCTLGCDALRISPLRPFLSYAGNDGPSWWTVGAFDGEALRIDKDTLKQRIDSTLNDGLRLCPHFNREALLAKIDALPEVHRTGDNGWVTLYNNDGKPAWLWPVDQRIPPTLRTTKDNPWRSGGLNIRVGFERKEGHLDDEAAEFPDTTPSTLARAIPPTRYTDIQGQDKAVETVRDLIELPLKHADLFARIGATPKAGGVILAGPPGTGKTLLARAVAGECGAHVEFVSGPELLSKWVGETEAALRVIFERAKALAPAVILFDEIDCLAVARGSADAQYQKSMVTQLLALLDGLEERGKVFVIATTNRPGDIDSALRRPGRFDRVIDMGPPDEKGRAAIFRHYLEPLVLDPTLNPDRLATELASLTPSLTGADIAHLCQSAARLCVKEASPINPPPKDLAISHKHFRQAVEEMVGANPTRRTLSTSRDPEPFNGIASPEPPPYLMRG